jgi:hypothetical protein
MNPMTNSIDPETLERIHRHDHPARPGFIGARIVDGPWKGYTIGEAITLSQMGESPRKEPAE